MFRVLVYLGALLLGVAVPARAQLADASHLTLPAAMAEAVQNNPDLAALRLESEATGSMPEAERHLMPPMLEAQIWAWPVTTLNPARTDMYMFMGEQELPGRGKRAARVLVAERDADLSRQAIAVRANEILAGIRQAFVELALARDLTGRYAGQTTLLEDIAEAATLRYAAGEGPQHHTVTTIVEIASIEQARIAAEERGQAAETALNTLLGRPPAQPVEALGPIGSLVSPAEAESRALAAHPEVAMAAAMVAREEAELERLRGERRPDFVVGGGYMLVPGEAGAWTARAGITWPNAPWSRGRLGVQLDVQTRRVEAARARRAVVTARLREIVREAVVRMTAAERQLRLLDTTVLPQIEHAFELSRIAYASGEGDFADVLEARRMWLTTQVDSAEASANLARARAALDAVAGAL